MTAVFKMVIVKMMTTMMTVYDVTDDFDVNKGDGVYCRRQLTCCFLGKQFIIKLFCCCYGLIRQSWTVCCHVMAKYER